MFLWRTGLYDHFVARKSLGFRPQTCVATWHNLILSVVGAQVAPILIEDYDPVLLPAGDGNLAVKTHADAVRSIEPARTPASRVEGIGFRVQGSGFRVYLGCLVP